MSIFYRCQANKQQKQRRENSKINTCYKNDPGRIQTSMIAGSHAQTRGCRAQMHALWAEAAPCPLGDWVYCLCRCGKKLIKHAWGSCLQKELQAGKPSSASVLLCLRVFADADTLGLCGQKPRQALVPFHSHIALEFAAWRFGLFAA